MERTFGGKTAFRFYPQTDSDGNLVYSPDSYVFKSGEKVLSKEMLTDSEGKIYFQITVYAYGMCEIIDYELQGTDIQGSYNIKKYHEYALSTNDSSLVCVVERLWKYSESAAAYKEFAS